MQDFKFKIGGKDYAANVVEEENGKLKVTVNGKAYEVEVPGHVSARPVIHPIKPAAPAAGGGPVAPVAPKVNSAAGSNSVCAPLPGTITKILVSEGQAVKAGDTVLIMEAMKMENNISAEADGTVKKIHVQSGAQVQSGELLIELA